MLQADPPSQLPLFTSAPGGTVVDFDAAFRALTGKDPFPWQRALYERFVTDPKENIPHACNLPTGLGKTAVIPIWLLALATAPNRIPRRLVYVVNRRTVVDQSTREAMGVRERLKDAPAVDAKLRGLCAAPLGVGEPPLAISTLRGQFADNREWSADPARPAVIVGTVDMIGSRLLFSGYGVGFKMRPLHAGFLGQDVLVVHDEAHLEPAFQDLLTAVEGQKRCAEFDQFRFRVMEMSATPRSTGDVFKLTPAEERPPAEMPDPPSEPLRIVWQRQQARKAIHLHANKDPRKLADELTDLALKHKDSGSAILVFARGVDDVEKVVEKLHKAKQQVEILTGTMRGFERDKLIGQHVFQHFMPGSRQDRPEVPATVYLVCTSAGEVGINISADHLVCDLSTFESMAQRFGRVNRFGDCQDTQIDVVHPYERDWGETDEYAARLKLTLELLRELEGDGSPASLGRLDPAARLAAFAPPPTILPVSSATFDAWTLTTIRRNLPGRPNIDPYLHGISGSQPPETHVAWREEVGIVVGDLLAIYQPADLLEDYSLKPHELLRDVSGRVYDRLKKLRATGITPVWIVSDDDSVEVTTLQAVIEAGKDALSYKTVLLPTCAGGLDRGLFTGNAEPVKDVADEWRNEQGIPRRSRDSWDNDVPPPNMRLVRTIDTKPDADTEGDLVADADATGTTRRRWHWYELSRASDNEGSLDNEKSVLWQDHTDHVTQNARRLTEKLPLTDELKRAVMLAAQWHDLGKRRAIFQRILGNDNPNLLLAKSGRRKRIAALPETYRHEFGSLIDVLETSQDFHAEFRDLSEEMRDVVLHLIAAHHGRARPHFLPEEVFDLSVKGNVSTDIASEVPRRFARLQRRYGRWGLAYLESLLRAADYAASADPSSFDRWAGL